MRNREITNYRISRHPKLASRQSPAKIKISELTLPDLTSGFLESLDNLIKGTSELRPLKAKKIFQEIQSNPLHKVFVAKTISKDASNLNEIIVVGTTTLLVEPKFIFSGCRVGHIEDVSVRKGFENLGIGRMLVNHATLVAEDMDCVKIVLDCSDETMPFYEKLGYSYQDNCMKKKLVK